MWRIKTSEEFSKYVTNECIDARAIIKKFSDSIVNSPGYELEWSGNAFAAAAILDVLGGFDDYFRRLATGELPTGWVQPDELLHSVRTSIAGQVVTEAKSIPNTSTSQTANLMTSYRHKVKAQLAEALGVGEY